MLNWLCRPLPPSAAVKESVSGRHAAVVTISGIAPFPKSINGLTRAPGVDAKAPPSTPSGTALSAASAAIGGLGILIHPALVLTTYSTIPSPLCIKNAEITFCLDLPSLTYVKRRFLPDMFFETSMELDLTVVSCEKFIEDPNYSLPLDTTRLHPKAFRRGHPIFILGSQMQLPDDIVIMEGYVTGTMSGHVQKDAFLCFQTVGRSVWMPGTAGFDETGSFAFMVTRPPGKLLGAMQIPFVKFGNEKEGIRSISCLDRLLSSHLPERKINHLATRVGAIKEWFVAMCKLNRKEIFQGSMESLNLDKVPRKPLTHGDALFKQKSTPRSIVSATCEASFSKKQNSPGRSVLANAQDQGLPCCEQGRDAEQADAARQHSFLSSLERNTRRRASSSCVQKRSVEDSMAIARVETDGSSSQEHKKTVQHKESVKPTFNGKSKLRIPSSCVKEGSAENAAPLPFIKESSTETAMKYPSVETHCSSAWHTNIDSRTKTLSQAEHAEHQDAVQSTLFSALAKQKGLGMLATRAANYKRPYVANS